MRRINLRRAYYGFAGLAAAACLSMTSGVASGLTITSDSPNSTEQLGTFDGAIDYDSSTMELMVSLTNTSPISNGGYITGFVLNIDGDASAMDLTMAPDSGFTLLKNEKASPFGTFEFGAALGGDFLGGGSPNDGIAVGDTGVFTFNITGSDAGSLTDANFFSESSSEGHLFAVRFKGFKKGSDKVPGVPGQPPTQPVPEPAGLLVGLGGMALLALRRRRTGQAA